MKRLTTVIAVLTAGCMVLSSCTSYPEEETLRPQESLDADYDDIARNLAIAVNKAASLSPGFRSAVKAGVLEQFDGDYDLLLSRASSLQIVPVKGVTTRSSGGFTVGDLLEHCFPDREKYTRSADGSIIEELSRSYPDLQVSVPVHAEEWDS